MGQLYDPFGKCKVAEEHTGNVYPTEGLLVPRMCPGKEKKMRGTLAVFAIIDYHIPQLVSSSITNHTDYHALIFINPV
jgi:hypothetical protein